MENVSLILSISLGYFLAVDHSTNSIVLSIRGTFHMRDALTDMVASYVPFKVSLDSSTLGPSPFIRMLLF